MWYLYGSMLVDFDTSKNLEINSKNYGIDDGFS